MNNGPWPRPDIITHPDAQLHVLSPVHLHPLIQQTNLFKVQPIHHKAANQGRAPWGVKQYENQSCLLQSGFAWHSCYSNSEEKQKNVTTCDLFINDTQMNLLPVWTCSYFRLD